MGAVILMHGTSVAAPEFKLTDRTGLYMERKLQDGRPVVISAGFAPYSALSGKSELYYGGDSPTHRPQGVITSVSISVAGRPIPVPVAAYSDLGDPSLHPLEVFPDGQNFIVRIYGGNGFNSYCADIFVHGSTVTGRRVTNSHLAAVAGRNYNPDVKTFK